MTERGEPSATLTRRGLLAGSLAVAGAAAGCVRIPTSGGVGRVSAAPRPSDQGIEVQPVPPGPNAPPLDIVNGFLSAMAYYQPDYAVAREYLTAGARAAWRPDSGTEIYSSASTPDGTADSARLVTRVTGRLGRDNAYTVIIATGETTYDFQVVKEAGQWRISKPPAGLLISEYSFQQFYKPFRLYFYEPGLRCVVPDLIHLPDGNQSATALLRRLLQGPTDWLRPAVVSALPDQTSLILSAPVDSDGVVEVAFNDVVVGLDDDQRSRVAGQICWTLRQVTPRVTGVRFVVNGTKWSVPRDETDGVVPVSSHEHESPIRAQLSDQLFGATTEGLGRVDPGSGRLEPAAGVWGSLERVTSLAVAPQANRLAAVRDTRVLVEGPPDGDYTERTNGDRLLRPQISRFDELWAFDGKPRGLVVMWMAAGAQRMTQVRSPGVTRGELITAFRFAPDGSRVAVVRELSSAAGTVNELALLRVVRSGAAPVLDGWRAIALRTSQSQILSRIMDVAWLDDVTLMVLAASGADGAVGAYRLTSDGSSLSSAAALEQVDPVTLAALPGVEPGVVVLDTEGTAWRLETNNWTQVAQDLTAIGYAS